MTEYKSYVILLYLVHFQFTGIKVKIFPLNLYVVVIVILKRNKIILNTVCTIFFESLQNVFMGADLNTVDVFVLREFKEGFQ